MRDGGLSAPLKQAVVCSGPLAAPFEELGVDVPLMFQIPPKRSWPIQSSKKQMCSKLVWSLVSSQAEARVSPGTGKVGSWELYLAGVSGCYHRVVFVHVLERREKADSHRLTLETFSSGAPVIPERSAWSVNTSTIPIFLRVFVIS